MSNDQKIYFTSDLHLGEDPKRHKLFFRDRIADNPEDFDKKIIENWNSVVGKNDKIYLVGDAAYSKDGLNKVSQLNGYKILIKGNYDDNFTNEELLEYFDELHDDYFLTIKDNSLNALYLNHYPINGDNRYFNIVGHIHSFWKVQRNMINVSVEVWDYKPVSLEEILFTYNGIKKFYDQNVFAGELECNNIFAKKDKEVFISGEKITSTLKPIFLNRNSNNPNWSKNFIYGLNKIDKDFIILDSNKIKTDLIEEDDSWIDKALDLVFEKNGIYVCWFDNLLDIDTFEKYFSIDEKATNPYLIIGLGFDEKSPFEEKYKDNNTIIFCQSFEEIYEKIKNLL